LILTAAITVAVIAIVVFIVVVITVVCVVVAVTVPELITRTRFIYDKNGRAVEMVTEIIQSQPRVSESDNRH